MLRGGDVDGLVPLKPGLIEVIEGFLTELTLPEKVDLCVFECGSLASEEFVRMKDPVCRGRPGDDAGLGWKPTRELPPSRRRVEGRRANARKAPCHRQSAAAGPDDPATYIPRRCQTYAAPVSYALHNLLTPPSYDWSKIVGKDPIRFNRVAMAYGSSLSRSCWKTWTSASPLPSLPASP